MAHPWPLFDLRIRTPRLELRLPSDDDLLALMALARSGVHDPGETPFLVPWDELPSLASQGLDALAAESGYIEGNAASANVPGKLGYLANGEPLMAPRGTSITEHNVRVTPATWSTI